MSLLIFAMLVVATARGQDLEHSVCRVFDDFRSVVLNCVHADIRFMDLAETIVPLGAFRMCTQTEVLDLSNNYIEEIVPGAFHGLYSLRELYLTNNQIKEIQTGTLIPLTKLQVLVLSENLLYTLPQGEIRSNSLHYLNLYNNKFVVIPNYDLQQLKLIDLLDLSNNNLAKLDENALINVESGCTINLSNNRLTSLAFKISVPYAKSTTIFLASGNCIPNITKESFGTLHYLKIVDLDLSFNQINFIGSGAFDSHVHLRHLHLSHNKLVELPTEIFQNLLELVSVDLSHNCLTNSIFDLQYPNSIEYLDYSHNLITYVVDFFWIPEYSEIQELNLMHNKITFLDANLVSRQIKSIWLSYNRWKCGVLYSLMENLQKRGIKVLGTQDLNWRHCEPQNEFHAGILQITNNNVNKSSTIKQELVQNETIKKHENFHTFESKLNVIIHILILTILLLILPFFL